MGLYAQTVTGAVPASGLGRTLMHEHILCDLRDPATREDGTQWPEITMENRFQINYFQNRNPANMLLDEDNVAVRDLKLFHEAGGGAIVELTIGGLRPQPERLAAIAAEAGVNIIIGAGYYVDAYLPKAIRNVDIDALQSIMSSQLSDGAWGSDVRAGIIGEIGCSWPLLPSECRMLAAAARTQRASGAAITIHPGRNPDAPGQIADILVAAGADPSRTIIGHMDRTIFDRDRLVDLFKQGFVLEWDFFGIETSQYWMAGEDLDLPTDAMRLDLIGDLMSLGYGEQITISHDICTKTRLAAYGGHGYVHLIGNIVPMMLRRGYHEDDIDQLLTKTPARLLGFLTEPPSSSPTARPS